MRRGRFAPSPTGPLHFGSLVAALASYCDARAHRGEWLVRIEDVDEPRTRSGAERAILRTLSHYGFTWDGLAARQTERTALYRQALDHLIGKQVAYACACTRRELLGARLGAGGERVYPGTCRAGMPAQHQARKQRAWRVLVDNTTITHVDRLQGVLTQSLAEEVGDFVVQRADGLVAYQLAVVVDDAEQGITDVVRGADLLSSTPRQIHLQRLLGVTTPSYLHVPVAINAAGEKLSKQTRAPALPEDPLEPLLAAWRFLEQPVPPRTPRSLAAFWDHALANWMPARLPPVQMLPAPARYT